MTERKHDYHYDRVLDASGHGPDTLLELAFMGVVTTGEKLADAAAAVQEVLQADDPGYAIVAGLIEGGVKVTTVAVNGLNGLAHSVMARLAESRQPIDVTIGPSDV